MNLLITALGTSSLPCSSPTKFKLMLIDNNKKIRDIQESFHKKFPFLKLEFYKGSHHEGESSPARERLNNELMIDEVRTIHSEGNLHIREEMSVAELERSFMQRFGLNAQVFRRSGNIWLQTSATDHWTLAEQNRKGGHSEELFKKKLSESD